jgi:hypothetical protein
MKIATLNLSPGSTGATTMGVPRGADLVSALMLSGVVQVNYAYEGDSNPDEQVDFLIVQNGQEYDGQYTYLSELVDSSKRVTHLLYKSAGSVQINPLSSSSLPKGA